MGPLPDQKAKMIALQMYPTSLLIVKMNHAMFLSANPALEEKVFGQVEQY